MHAHLLCMCTRSIHWRRRRSCALRLSDAIEAADAAGILWLVENPAERHSGPAYWPAKAHCVSLWDMPEFKALTRDIACASTTIMQCQSNGSPFQKATKLLAPASAASCLARYLGRTLCTCRSHGEHAVGLRSAKSAAYPPALCAAITDFVEACA